MIKNCYLKESLLPSDDENKARNAKKRSHYFNFADFDERRNLRAVRLGMYFRQSLIGMIKYKEHGNVLAEDFEDS